MAEAGDTYALRVTAWPTTEGFGDEEAAMLAVIFETVMTQPADVLGRIFERRERTSRGSKQQIEVLEAGEKYSIGFLCSLNLPFETIGLVFTLLVLLHCIAAFKYAKRIRGL